VTAARRTIQRYQFASVNQDLPPNMLPPEIYSAVTNMEPFDIGMRGVRGAVAAFGTPLFTPEYLAFVTSPTGFFWLYAGSNGIGVTNGQAHFDITPAAGIVSSWPTNWTHGQLNGLPVLNNGIDVPVWWNRVPANIMQPLPGWPANTTAGVMRAYNYNLIALDIRDSQGEFDNHLLWSNSADPGVIPDSWTPLPENDAGFNTLADQPGSLLDGIQVRDSFMLFKEHSTYLMNYIGGNFVFNFRKLFTTSGILSSNCASEYLGNVAVLTDGDFILTDGQRADSLIDKKMRSWLFNNIDSDNYRTSFVVSYQSENQIWCCFPENGASEPNLALVYDASDGRFGIRELKPAAFIGRGQVGNVSGVVNWDDDDQAWDDDGTGWNQSLFNPTEDALLQADRIGNQTLAINEGNDIDGVAITHRVERSGLDLGDPETVKLVRAVVPRVIGLTGTVLTIRIGAAPNDDDVITWSPPVTFTIGGSQKIDLFAQGRFLAFSVESTLDQAPWTITGMDFDYDTQGRF